MTGPGATGDREASGRSAGSRDAAARKGSEASGGQTIVVEPQDALFVVDAQRDFCPGGSLGVPDGCEIIPVINRLIPLFSRWVYTRDWHPPGHVSFSRHPEFRDGSWPPHAVQGTPGAEWCADLVVPADALMASHGDDPLHESYSAFQSDSFDLTGFLHEQGVRRIFITGLATDYCVRQTSLDAVGAGFTVLLVEDGVRGIAPETTALALAGLEAAGVSRVWSRQLTGGRGAAASEATPSAEAGDAGGTSDARGAGGRVGGPPQGNH